MYRANHRHGYLQCTKEKSVAVRGENEKTMVLTLDVGSIRTGADQLMYAPHPSLKPSQACRHWSWPSPRKHGQQLSFA